MTCFPTWQASNAKGLGGSPFGLGGVCDCTRRTGPDSTRGGVALRLRGEVATPLRPGDPELQQDQYRTRTTTTTTTTTRTKQRHTTTNTIMTTKYIYYRIHEDLTHRALISVGLPHNSADFHLNTNTWPISTKTLTVAWSMRRIVVGSNGMPCAAFALVPVTTVAEPCAAGRATTRGWCNRLTDVSGLTARVYPGCCNGDTERMGEADRGAVVLRGLAAAVAFLWRRRCCCSCRERIWRCNWLAIGRLVPWQQSD